MASLILVCPLMGEVFSQAGFVSGREVRERGVRVAR